MSIAKAILAKQESEQRRQQRRRKKPIVIPETPGERSVREDIEAEKAAEASIPVKRRGRPRQYTDAARMAARRATHKRSAATHPPDAIRIVRSSESRRRNGRREIARIRLRRSRRNLKRT